jgi:hypothetical protein
MSKSRTHRKPTELSGLVVSGLRTLEAEAGGITALVAAMQDGMGVAFTAAVEAIRAARGRVVVTGMGKSGHIGRKIAPPTCVRPWRKRPTSCSRCHKRVKPVRTIWHRPHRR